jgi:hypothetical protein
MTSVDPGHLGGPVETLADGQIHDLNTSTSHTPRM